MKTILLVITKADVGGAQIHCLDIIKRLQGQYRFLLVCGEEEYLSKSARQQGIEVIILTSLVRPISVTKDIQAYRDLKHTILRIRPDLVHAHSSKAGVIARLAAARAGVPCIFTAHGWAFTQGAPSKQRFVGLVSEWCLKRLTAATITVSEYDYNLALRYHAARRGTLHLILNGVENKPAKSTNKALSKFKGPQIINIGRLTPVKNQQYLISCLALLEQDYRAIIIGSGDDYVALQAQIIALGLQEKVRVLQDIEEVSDWLAHSDIFVLTSKYEGLPLSVLEAMSAKLPVIAHDVGGVAEAVVQGETGFLVKPGARAQFIAKLQLLLKDAGLRQAMGRAGQQRYQQHFTAQRMAAQIDVVYQDVLNKL